MPEERPCLDHSKDGVGEGCRPIKFIGELDPTFVSKGAFKEDMIGVFLICLSKRTSTRALIPHSSKFIRS